MDTFAYVKVLCLFAQPGATKSETFDFIMVITIFDNVYDQKYTLNPNFTDVQLNAHPFVDDSSLELYRNGGLFGLTSLELLEVVCFAEKY